MSRAPGPLHDDPEDSECNENIYIADLEQPAQISRYWIMETEQLRQFAGQGQVVHDNNAFFLPINAEMHELIQSMQLAAVRGNR